MLEHHYHGYSEFPSEQNWQRIRLAVDRDITGGVDNFLISLEQTGGLFPKSITLLPLIDMQRNKYPMTLFGDRRFGQSHFIAPLIPLYDVVLALGSEQITREDVGDFSHFARIGPTALKLRLHRGGGYWSADLLSAVESRYQQQEQRYQGEGRYLIERITFPDTQQNPYMQIKAVLEQPRPEMPALNTLMRDLRFGYQITPATSEEEQELRDIS